MRALALAVVLLLAPSQAQARWPNGSAGRLQAAWPLLQEAADAAGLPPGFEVVLAAVCVHETGLRGLRGGLRREMFGPCQVHWRSWGARLAEAGVADRAEELLDVQVGVLAGAFVLAWLLQEYSNRAPAVAVCAYGCGEKAEAWERCEYSAAVAENVGLVLDVIGGRRGKG